MTTQNPCALAPVVSIVKNQVTALSTDVAKFFHKEHFNVVRDIEKLLKSLPISRAFNFEESTISIPSNLNNTSNRVIKAYRMTRDGFTLLVMGWTGEKALQFKLAWLDAFNAMEEQLRKQQCLAENNLATLTPAQQYAIKSAVAARAQKEPAKYKEIYSALKRRFQVARY
ncbi:Rha family transcriptional regulator [uncultured Parasutterella sp.]|nr:Rha family transcriptional regulator [uncultured Parasutterella sp.]